jgi:hypothetical protein
MGEKKTTGWADNDSTLFITYHQATCAVLIIKSSFGFVEERKGKGKGIERGEREGVRKAKGNRVGIERKRSVISYFF